MGEIKAPTVPRQIAGVMLPSLFTVGNMGLGFYAIVAAFNRDWIGAPVAIFVAHFLDILDGRLARWIGHTTRFGAQFDSFADWISFGIAPGIMVYLLTLKEYGKLGFVLTFFYVFAGALRLARFNVKSLDSPTGSSGLHFVGLPIPGAGGFLAILVLLYGLFEDGNQGRTLKFLYNNIPYLEEGIPVIVFSLGLLMMSKIQYTTFKRTPIFRPQSLTAFLITLFVVFMIYVYPQNTIFILYVGYILWGIASTMLHAYRISRRPPITKEV